MEYNQKKFKQGAQKMEKKIPFFKKVIISIKDLDKYNLLITEKMRRSIIYLLEIIRSYDI